MPILVIRINQKSHIVASHGALKCPGFSKILRIQAKGRYSDHTHERVTTTWVHVGNQTISLTSDFYIYLPMQTIK